MTILRIKMFCNWCSSKQLCDLWNKLGDGDYSFTNGAITLQMVWEDKCDNVDYIVVVNGTAHHPSIRNLKKTIFIKIEPVLHDSFWSYVHINPQLLKAVYTHQPGNYNNNEWHLSMTRNELINNKIVKTYDQEISTVLSDKFIDTGHRTRINFALTAQYQLPWHSYGGNFFKWKNYKGTLQPYQKDNALIPYKYTFNMENTDLHGYYTEKLIDAILCECLCFYSGPPDIEELINPKAYVRLDFTQIMTSIETMKKAIKEDWWSQRIEYIKEAKQKILFETGFFPRLMRTILEK